MSDDAVKFAAEFPPATLEQWRAVVDKALKGASFEKRLVTRLYEGIAVQPLYTAEDWDAAGDPSGFPGFAPFTRGGHADGAGTGGWAVLTEHAVTDPKQANKAILEDLMRGATAIGLELDHGGTLPDLDQVLAEVQLEFVPLSLAAGEQSLAAAAALTALWQRRGVEQPQGAFNIDPIGTLASTGSLADSLDQALKRMAECAIRTNEIYETVTAVGVDSSPYFEAGATESQDLAAAMATGVAYLKALTEGGLGIDAALGQIHFTMAVGCDQFLSIAKLRAARRLWARIAEACGASETLQTMRLTARTAGRIMSRRDPWVNMLRTTVAGFAAGAGGADSVAILPFDAALGVSNDFARRIARNIQILLKEESNIARVTDPAGGSWYVETLTEQLAQAAWTEFQAIEAQGGIAAVLADGSFAGKIKASWAERAKNIARRKDPLTGVSEFPNLLEDALVRDTLPGRTASTQIEPLPRHRVHEEFEALRDAADRYKAETGAWPTIFLVNMGTVAQHTARATFSKNFFEAGGIQALGNNGFAEPAAAAEAFKTSGARIAILCGSDALYETQAAPFAAALKGAGVEHLFLAGNPGEHRAGYEQAGIDEFISAGMDVLSVLRSVLGRLGVTL